MADEVRLECTQRGMRREVRCTLVTWNEASSTGRLYTRGRITGEPPDLPDGSYAVSFGEHSVVTRKWEGHWLLRYLPGSVEAERAA